jgi:hypothetical protein
MSRTEGAGDSARHGAEQQAAEQQAAEQQAAEQQAAEQQAAAKHAAAKTQTEREARDFAEETGYRPSVNQRRHEPLPASRHDERPQEAVVRNEEHASDRPQATPSPRAPSRREG